MECQDVIHQEEVHTIDQDATHQRVIHADTRIIEYYLEKNLLIVE